MKVKVLIPFHFKAAEQDCEPGDIIDVTAEQLTNIRKVNVNMVEVVKVEKKKPANKPAEKKKEN